jgi:predicted nucleic acid-binding protein
MDYYVELLYRYRSKGVVVDTNLLLAYFVGSYDPAWIAKFKRTLTFTVEDFYTLKRVFDFFDKVVTTPNILTEVNSLANQLPMQVKQGFNAVMSKIVVTLDEHYQASVVVCALEQFQKFGLADAGIIELVKGRHLVLTDDFKLANYIEPVGIDAINFNHIRPMNWKL